jgi:outer membrane protein, multidrug efflux system
LDAQSTLVGSRQQLVQANVALSNDVVELYNALGGGWQEAEARRPPPQVDGTPPPVLAAIDAVAARETRP